MIDYEAIIQELLKEYKDQCTGNLGENTYRRVKWELYNPKKEWIEPAVGEEWETEVISFLVPKWTSAPFGGRSDDIYEKKPDPTPPSPPTPEPGRWHVPKINYEFNSEQEIIDYVESIGATLISEKDWYGADLNKKNLFKNVIEVSMYQVENTGGLWRRDGDPVNDRRSFSEYCPDNNNFTVVSMSGLAEGGRTKYLKYSSDKSCTYVGFAATLPVDTSIPGIPKSVDPVMPDIPWPSKESLVSDTQWIDPDCFIAPDMSLTTVPVTIQFPYTGIAKAVMDTLGKSDIRIKFKFPSLPGSPEPFNPLTVFETMYDRAASSMEEVAASALAFSQAALTEALKDFREKIDQLFGIIGGAWDMIESFLPDVSVSGINFDIMDIVFNAKPVHYIQTKVYSAIESGQIKASEFIDSVSALTGGAMEYNKQKVQMVQRDVADACQNIYQYALKMIQNGSVALCKLAGEIAQLWSIPPFPGNPIWAAIKAIRELLPQIKPLDVVMSGNFPGFDASEIYDSVSEYIGTLYDEAVGKINGYMDQIKNYKTSATDKNKEYQDTLAEYRNYIKGVYGTIEQSVIDTYKQTLASLESQITSIKDKIKTLEDSKSESEMSINDIVKIGMDYLKSLPVMEKINEYLGMAGVAFDDILTLKENAASGAVSIQEKFVAGFRALNDIIKSTMDQIYTLALSKVSQWLDKLLGIFGFILSPPPITIPVPVITFKYSCGQ